MRNYLDLPVYRHRQDIVEALRDHQVIVVESPTGSGKTTQIPLILDDAGYTSLGVVGVTQPRRIAALGVTKFIRKQTGEDNSYTACKMRFHDTTDADTRIKIMTDGILLEELKYDALLSSYSVIMVDEAHERSLNIDLILGLLKKLLPMRPDLRLIISSATINAASFSEYFDGAPVISIDGKPYSVKVYHQKVQYDTEYFDKAIRGIIRKTINNPDGGDMLIFLPGEADIRKCIFQINTYMPEAKDLEIYPLYGALTREEQVRVFTLTSPGKRKVVVATNIAETSLTIDGIRTVIDSGMCKRMAYHTNDGISSLDLQTISRASADQRKGRAGRTAPGVCYRLYGKKDSEHWPEYTLPEICISDLSETVLRMVSLGIHNPEEFPFMTAPNKYRLLEAIQTLQEIGAITEDRTLTHIGSLMTRIPMTPRRSRIIVESVLERPYVLTQVCIVTAFMDCRRPFASAPDPRQEAWYRSQQHELIDNPKGDFFAWLKMYETYTALKDDKVKQNWCTNWCLDKEAMDEIVNVCRQVFDLGRQMCTVENPDYDLNDYGTEHIVPDPWSWTMLLKCVATGYGRYIACKETNEDDDEYEYDRYYGFAAEWFIPGSGEVAIHPGSSQWKSTGVDWMLCADIVETSRAFARACSPVTDEVVEEASPEAWRRIEEKKAAERAREAARRERKKRQNRNHNQHRKENRRNPKKMTDR